MVVKAYVLARPVFELVLFEIATLIDAGSALDKGAERFLSNSADPPTELHEERLDG